jgi:hypothetical protein
LDQQISSRKNVFFDAIGWGFPLYVDDIYFRNEFFIPELFVYLDHMSHLVGVMKKRNPTPPLPACDLDG